jgi:hypothetical protein
LFEQTKTNFMQTAILVAQLVGFIAAFIVILGIRRKSKQIISQGGKSYHFDIVYGPSAEEILTKSPHEWPPHFGFEVAPYHEPDRNKGLLKENTPKERKAISYLFCPDRLDYIYPKGSDRFGQIYPSLVRDERSGMKNRIESFLESDDQVLVMDGFIYKEKRGSVYAYFGGGELFTYGTEWKMKITYDCKMRTGTMIVVEE